MHWGFLIIIIVIVCLSILLFIFLPLFAFSIPNICFTTSGFTVLHIGFHAAYWYLEPTFDSHICNLLAKPMNVSTLMRVTRHVVLVSRANTPSLSLALGSSIWRKHYGLTAEERSFW